MGFRSVGTLASVIGAVLLCVTPRPSAAGPNVVRDSGDVTDSVAAFQQALGEPLNGVTVGEQTAGRREINWDKVAGEVTNTDTFSASFFNTTSPRGAIFANAASGFRVSDNNFADVNATYSGQFNFFSASKSFAPIGSNILDVTFQVAGGRTPAAVSGFGAVFSDVDVAGSTKMEFFRGGVSLGVFEVPVRSDAGGLSFLGVMFAQGITRVRITAGQAPIAADRNDLSSGGNVDLVVMDDFLYGEPHADSDQDGVFDPVDQRAGSDTRAKVDLNPDVVGQTRVDNRVLTSGLTFQDQVNDARASARNKADYVRRIMRWIDALKKARLISNDEQRDLKLAITSGYSH